MGKGFFKSYLKEVNKDLQKGKKDRLIRSAKHVVKKMKQKANRKGRSRPGQSPGRSQGNYRKGIGYKFIKAPVNKFDDDFAIVGAAKPAQHFHLMELGTKNRVQKTTGKSTGRVKPRPLLGPMLRQESTTIQKIMSGKIL